MEKVTKTKTLLIASILMIAACSEKDDGFATLPDDSDNGNQVQELPEWRPPIAFTTKIETFSKQNFLLSEDDSRNTIDNGWAGILEDRVVSVKIDDVVKDYVVNNSGILSSDDPFYWEEREEVTVDAWYPSNGGVRLSDTEIFVYSDQSSVENFLKNDLLEVVSSKVTPSDTDLSFRHRMAMLVCKLNMDGLETEESDAEVSILGLKQLKDGATVLGLGARREAIVVPQTISSGESFIEVNIPKLHNFTCIAVTESTLVLEGGRIYSLEINVSEEGKATVTISNSVSWGDEDEEELPGNASGINPDTNAPSWECDGNNENLVATEESNNY